MAKMAVSVYDMKNDANELLQISKSLKRSATKMINLSSSVDICSRQIIRRNNCVERVNTAAVHVEQMAYSLQDISDMYRRTEDAVLDMYGGRVGASIPDIKGNLHQKVKATLVPEDNKVAYKSSWWNMFQSEFQSNYGLKDVLKGSGYIGRVYNLYQEAKSASSPKDYKKLYKSTKDFYSEAITTYKNYKKIGNAVGAKKATTWWAKAITGMKPLGRASTAKNTFTRFKNNLFNKTSPFNLKKQLSKEIGNFTGAQGVGNAIASWGQVAVSGITNWFSNKEEQKNSGGTMSDGRVIAETVTETVIEVVTDTVISCAAKAVVGAAVTTALGSVAAPGILVVAATGLVVAAGKSIIDSGFKYFTGKTSTEWASDLILDTATEIGKKVGSAAKAVGNAVSNVKKVVGNAVGNATKSVGNAIGGWFRKLSFS